MVLQTASFSRRSPVSRSDNWNGKTGTREYKRGRNTEGGIEAKQLRKLHIKPYKHTDYLNKQNPKEDEDLLLCSMIRIKTASFLLNPGFKSWIEIKLDNLLNQQKCRETVTIVEEDPGSCFFSLVICCTSSMKVWEVQLREKQPSAAVQTPPGDDFKKLFEKTKSLQSCYQSKGVDFEESKTEIYFASLYFFFLLPTQVRMCYFIIFRGFQ